MWKMVRAWWANNVIITSEVTTYNEHMNEHAYEICRLNNFTICDSLQFLRAKHARLDFSDFSSTLVDFPPCSFISSCSVLNFTKKCGMIVWNKLPISHHIARSIYDAFPSYLFIIIISTLLCSTSVSFSCSIIMMIYSDLLVYELSKNTSLLAYSGLLVY